MISPSKIIPCVIMLLMTSLSLFGFNDSVENDTIRPVLINQPIDLIVGCSGDYVSELREWIEIDGGALASDNSGEVSIETTIELAAIQDSLDNSLGSFCDAANSFEIGFFAIDTCGNTSIDTSFARFQITDNVRPVLDQSAASVQVHCDGSAQDTLNRWVSSFGGAIARDECSPTVEWFRIIWNDSEGNSNTGHPTDGPAIPVDRENCNWTVTVSFFVRDLCGNNNITTASFSLQDTIAPTFVNPQASVTIACNQISDGLAVTDNCNTDIEARFEDISTTQSQDSTSCEFFNYTLERLWTVSDDCGNTSTFRQNIEVVDTIIPTFTVPSDITIFCGADIQPAVTGFPTDVVDNCNPNPLVIFSDSGTPEGCESVISRFWQIADGCGSSNIIPQQITIMDTISPMITVEAESLSLSCEDPDTLVSMFDAWLGNIGGASAEDDCANLDWFAAVPGSYDINDSSTFPGDLVNSVDDLACGSNEVMVDFVFIDECDNAAVTSAIFTLIDSIPPSFDESFEEIIIDADTSCVINTVMIFPSVSDNCLPDSQIVRQIKFEDRIIELAEDRYDTLLPIGVFDFSYIVRDCSGNADSIASSITIRDLTDPIVTCPEDFEAQVDLSNCIAEVAFAVDSIASDNCTLDHITYSITGNTIVSLDTIFNTTDSLLLSLNAGNNQVTYVATDESGNQSTCSFNVNVSDADFQEIECKSETIFLPISDPNPFQLADSLFIENLVDNCFIDSIFIPVTELTCDLVGTTRGIQLTIFDKAGNSQNCTSVISVEVERFEASYENNFCSSDTLRLFANVSLLGDIDQNVYSWSGPNNYVSTIPSPELTGVDPSFSGLYIVEVTGEAGCSQRDTVEVTIDLFETPTLSTLDTVSCLSDTITLNATSYDFDVLYNWFEGVFPDGNLIDTSSASSLAFPTEGSGNDFYVIVERDECTSDPSNILNLQLVDVTPPVISCPQDTMVSIDSLSCLVSTQLPINFEATDDCGFDEDMTVSYSLIGNGISIQDTLAEDNQIDDLAAGVYIANYFIQDKASNVDSCSFSISVLDTIAPILNCQNDSINLSLQQLNDFSVDDLDILSDVSDNCMVDTVLFAPNRIDCAIISEQIVITITAMDDTGNSSECISTVQVMLDTLSIEFTSGICPGDTLILSSNISDTTDLIFDWEGPNGFSSNDPMPMITNPSVQNNGTYTLSVGAEGSCFIDTELDIEVVEFVTPTVASAQRIICDGDSLRLTTQNYGGNVTYNWFLGEAPNGELVGQETRPSFVYQPDLGPSSLYVVVENETCASDPSPSFEVNVLAQPSIMLASQSISVCEGESFSISVDSPDEAFSYEWIGPDNFSASEPTVNLTASNSTQGIYQVVAKLGECISDTMTAEVALMAGGILPVLEGQQQYCPGTSLRLTVANITSSASYDWTLDGELFTTTTDNILEIDNATEDLTGSWQVSINGDCGEATSDLFEIEVLSDLNVTASSNAPICGTSILELEVDSINGASYSWEGPAGFSSTSREPELDAVAGIYTVTVTANETCESISSVEVRIEALPSIISITSNQESCVDISELVLTADIANIPNATYEWTGPNNFRSTDEIAIVQNFEEINEGVYSLIIFDGECSSQPSNIVIEQMGILATPNIRSGNDICLGTSFTIDVTSATDNIDEYIWTTPNGEVITTEPELTITDSSDDDGGNYSLVVRSDDCESASSEAIVINVGSTLDAPRILSQGEFCNGETIQLEVEFQDGEYEWRGPNDFEADNANPVIFNVDGTFEGSYEVRVTVEDCTSPWSEAFELSLVEIPVTPTPELADDILCISDYAGDFELCVDETSVIDGARYVWLSEATGDTIGVSDQRCFLLPTLDRLRPGRNNLNVTTIQGNCFSDVSERVTLTLTDGGGALIEADAGEDIFVCEDFVELSALLGVDERGTWSSPSLDVDFGDPSDPGSTAMGLVQGENIFIWSVSGSACSAGSDSLSIFLASEPVLADDEFSFASGQQIVIDPLDNDLLPVVYSFDIVGIEGASGADASDPRALLLDVDGAFSGDVVLTYQICNEECENAVICSEAQAIITVEGEQVCEATSLITPNGDGLNDNFTIPCLSGDGFPDNRVIIFNQWGDEVFSAQPYVNNWQGTFNGEDLPVGTYFFILDLGTGQQPQDGFIQIER